ncbi:MAG: c-type cytochrome [Pseudomonadota bacterium]
MDGYELNKFFGALTGALMVFLLVTFGTEMVLDPNYGHHHGEEKPAAFAMELPDAPVAEDPEPAEPVISMAALMADASLEDGAKTFKRRCASCHNVDPGGKNGTGPALHGVLGRQIAAVDGYRYSDALLAKADEVWTWEAMNGFLANTQDWAPGSKMRLKVKESERGHIMAYLNANSDAPIDPPAAEPEAPAAEEASLEEAAPLEAAGEAEAAELDAGDAAVSPN